MPSNEFYGGAGVDVLCPPHMMNHHHFSSEPEWNPSHLVRLVFLRTSSGNDELTEPRYP